MSRYYNNYSQGGGMNCFDDDYGDRGGYGYGRGGYGGSCGRGMREELRLQRRAGLRLRRLREEEGPGLTITTMAMAGRGSPRSGSAT